MKWNWLFLLIELLFGSKNRAQQAQMKDKIVIAHRGASGYLPEHTMEAKAMAYAMNADYIEQDLVLSKDDIPIVIHDLYLDDVTNVAQVFPNRKRKDNRFYVIDFTFEELQTLQVRERFNPITGNQIYPNRFPKNKGNFKLHSLQQEIALIQGLNNATGKIIGIYPEIKAPSFHQKEGKKISEIVLAVLADAGYHNKKDLCIVQCFDAKELERIRVELKSDLFLVQLIALPASTNKLAHFAKYADGVGPWYPLILDKKEHGKWQFTSLVTDAHKHNLKLHPYTFRADQLEQFSSFEEMMQVLFYEAHIDGAFTDFPDKMISFLKPDNY